MFSAPNTSTAAGAVSPDTAPVWAAHFPGLTPLEAYQAACRARDEHAALRTAVAAVAAELPDLAGEAELPAWRARLAAAKTALARHGGLPAAWIGPAGDPAVPDGICWDCLRPGADHTDHEGGRARGRHTACCTAARIRSDLLCSVSTRLLWGEQDRARMWEQRALAAHQRLGGEAAQ